jgi:hypothetical protein
MYFGLVENLHKMEQSEQWEAIRKLLYEKWITDKSNLKALIRLASECWLIMTDWDCCINNEGLDYELFKRNLMESCSYGLEHFDDDEKILCLFGYMMSLFPGFFYSNNDLTGQAYLDYENKGKSMLEKAYNNYPDNPLVRVLFLGLADETKKYNDAKIELKPHLSSLFPGETAIEQYFKEILSG